FRFLATGQAGLSSQHSRVALVSRMGTGILAGSPEIVTGDAVPATLLDWTLMGYRQDVPVLDRLLDPLSRCLTPEVAHRIPELGADPVLHARMDWLDEKCSEGLLTTEEREEYEIYVSDSRFIAILQAQARRVAAGPSAQ